MDSSEKEETDGINSLEDFIQHANDYVHPSQGSSVSDEGSEVELKKPYDQFVDLAPPYSHRLRCLKHLIRDPYEARLLVGCTTTDSAFCLGSKLAFVPVLEPGQGFRDKSLEAFVPGGRTGTKGA